MGVHAGRTAESVNLIFMMTRIFSAFSVALIFLAGMAMANDPMIVKRATVANFITDPIVLGNVSQADDVSTTLPSTFVMTHPTSGRRFTGARSFVAW